MLQVSDLRVDLGGRAILRGIDLHVARGEVVCILGPSGCGKTTLLRAIAGLERPASGTITLGGQSLDGVPTHARSVGLMFQDYALFPHLNVEENVRFGLRMQGLPRHEQRARVSEILDLVGLRGMARRSVHELSGGERQRVALARSLAPRPSLLMLDEPLGSLDAALKQRLMTELTDLIRELKLTVLYVTHDRMEAFAIADRVVIMQAGEIVEQGTPQMLYSRPQKRFTAEFLGLQNVFPIQGASDQEVTTALGTFSVDGQGQGSALLIHPQGIRIAPDGRWQGKIETVIYGGDSYTVTAVVDNQRLMFHVPAFDGRILKPDQPVRLAVDPRFVLLLQG